MKNASEVERIALEKILKFRSDGGRREEALELAKSIFRLKADKVVPPEAGLRRRRG